MQVESTGNSIRGILGSILPRSRVTALVDRDDKADEEITEWETNGGLVLRERNLESYLFADEVIEALVSQADKPNLLQEALAIKSRALSASVARGNPNDDLKSAAGQIYIKLKSLLELDRPGDDVDAFMRVTMAPLIVPGMQTYQDLKSAIIDKLP